MHTHTHTHTQRNLFFTHTHTHTEHIASPFGEPVWRTKRKGCFLSVCVCVYVFAFDYCATFSLQSRHRLIAPRLKGWHRSATRPTPSHTLKLSANQNTHPVTYRGPDWPHAVRQEGDTQYSLWLSSTTAAHTNTHTHTHTVLSLITFASCLCTLADLAGTGQVLPSRLFPLCGLQRGSGWCAIHSGCGE